MSYRRRPGSGSTATRGATYRAPDPVDRHLPGLDLKTTIELRPIFHRLEHRIRAHVLLSWLALLLIRVAERQTGHTWRRIALELDRLHLVTLTGPAGTIAQTTELTDLQRELYAATGVQPPPRITALQPA